MLPIRRIIIGLIFLSLLSCAFSEERTLYIYKYENESYGGGMSEYIDITFYDDGVIKSIYSYWPEFEDKIGPGINAWKNDGFERDHFKIMWQFPQYNVLRVRNSIIIELLRYDEDMNLVESESDHNYRKYIYNPESNNVLISDAIIQINDDFSYDIEKNGEILMQYEIDKKEGSYKYSYASSHNYHEYIFENNYYRRYNYYTVNDLLSKWRYEIEIDDEQDIYNIMSYDSTRPRTLFENKYIVRTNKIDIVDYASCLNYFILPGRLRFLLPFVTNTPVMSQNSH